MRAKEFLPEYIDDLHYWVSTAANKIKGMIDNGEIPNNPDSIKNAAKELAMNMKTETEGLNPTMIAREIENMVSLDTFKNAHLSGPALT